MLKKKQRKSPPRLDAANLAGLTSLMNPQGMRPDVDLEAAERAVMETGARPAAPPDPLAAYQEGLATLASGLGLAQPFVSPDGGGAPPAPPPRPRRGSEARGDGVPEPLRGHAPRGGARPRNPIKKDAIETLLAELRAESGDESGEEESGAESGATDGAESDAESDAESGAEEETGEASGSDEAEGGGGEASEGESEGAADPRRAAAAVTHVGRRFGVDPHAIARDDRRRRRLAMFPGGGGPARTEEQERRAAVAGVVEDLRGELRTAAGRERQGSLDAKADMVEEIAQLRQLLTEDGVDCAAIPVPTLETPDEEVERVRYVLRRKNNTNRYSTLAEEIILGSAEVLETVFDGTREVPVLGWKPDYTGYHNTVNVKLRRIRPETAQLVGNVMGRRDVGPLTRIALELLPSFILYPRQKKSAGGRGGLHADPRIARSGRDARAAFTAIRDADVEAL